MADKVTARKRRWSIMRKWQVCVSIMGALITVAVLAFDPLTIAPPKSDFVNEFFGLFLLVIAPSYNLWHALGLYEYASPRLLYVSGVAVNSALCFLLGTIIGMTARAFGCGEARR